MDGLRRPKRRQKGRRRAIIGAKRLKSPSLLGQWCNEKGKLFLDAHLTNESSFWTQTNMDEA